MTPKEKVQELVKKFQYRQRGLVVTMNEAKQCALICVDEIMRAIDREHAYWEQVKTEIEKL